MALEFGMLELATMILTCLWVMIIFAAKSEKKIFLVNLILGVIVIGLQIAVLPDNIGDYSPVQIMIHFAVYMIAPGTVGFLISRLVKK